MDHFVFESSTKLVLDKNAEQLIGMEVAGHSSSVLLVHSGDAFLYSSGLYDAVVNSFKKAEVTCMEISGVQPNPVLGPIYDGIRLCKELKIRFVVALGGGSVVDTAKTIAAGALYEGDVWDFFVGKASVSQALPIGTIMTLPGTGSEGSNGAVISNEKTHEKKDMMHDALRPKFVLMNPELTFTLPTFQTACGIVDMISHVMERYFTSSIDTTLIDHVCEGLMKSMMINGRKVMKNPRDYNARAELMVSAILAHNGLAGIGRNQDWSSHIIAAQLSAEYGSVHGATLSVIIPAWASCVQSENIPRFAQFANRVLDVEVDFNAPEKTALEGIEKLKAFYRELGMPTTLKELGVENQERFAEMTKKACANGPFGCIKQLDEKDVLAIYKTAI